MILPDSPPAGIPPALWGLRAPDDHPCRTRPGPHRMPDGRLLPPCGTYGEMLQRGLRGDPPRPLPERLVERGLVTLDDDETAAAVVSVLMPALRVAVREIVAEMLREDAA